MISQTYRPVSIVLSLKVARLHRKQNSTRYRSQWSSVQPNKSHLTAPQHPRNHPFYPLRLKNYTTSPRGSPILCSSPILNCSLILNCDPILNCGPIFNRSLIFNHSPILNHSHIFNRSPIFNHSPLPNHNPILNSSPALNGRTIIKHMSRPTRYFR